MSAPSLLYVASASAADPLIVSQVIRYLERMRPNLTACHLITFERDATPDQARTAAQMNEAGIDWHPIEAWSRLRSAGFWIDRHRALTCARQIVARERIDVVHCRSFLAGTLGRKLKSNTVRFLYDMRGLWSLEKRDKGTIRNPLMFGIARSLEQRLFEEADYIVSLTHQGKRYLHRNNVEAPIDVIPTCVDLERFVPRQCRTDSLRTNDSTSDNRPLKIVSAGTLGAGYLASEMFQFGALLQDRWPGTSFRILTASRRDSVMSAARDAGIDTSSLQVSRVKPEAVPDELATADAGLCFVRPTEAKVASCPTKLGEYLACGIPVVATDGIGDVTEILQNNRVGVVVRHDDESSWHDAVRKLETLLSDPALSSRCRQVAEAEFGLSHGAESYLRIYRQLIGMTSATQRKAA